MTTLAQSKYTHLSQDPLIQLLEKHGAAGKFGLVWEREDLKQALGLVHLRGEHILGAEQRSAAQGEVSTERDEVVLHLREYVLHLQGEKLNLPHLTPLFARAS